MLLLTCVNCDEPIYDTKWPYLYCSELCKEEAKYVRYKRAKIREGTIDDFEIQLALQTKFAFILSGGYPEQERRLTSEQRARVFARDGGRCHICGAAGTSIDHISGKGSPDGDINHPDNLQLLCKECHDKKTQSSMRQITPESDPGEFLHYVEKWDELEQRVDAEDPERPCDDDLYWNDQWKAVAQERGQLIKTGVAPRFVRVENRFRRPRSSGQK